VHLGFLSTAIHHLLNRKLFLPHMLVLLAHLAYLLRSM
jgi:hypothetical protein